MKIVSWNVNGIRAAWNHGVANFVIQYTVDVYPFPEFHRAIWTIANELRSVVDGWTFKKYVLGTMFYRYSVGRIRK